jgi:predicted RNA methylase
MTVADTLEAARLALQVELDGEKTQAERNKLGQFATPTQLADDILGYAKTLLPAGEPIRFIDPAIGTGSFYSALRRTLPADQIRETVGIEIDPHYAGPARKLWSGTKLVYQLGDFTEREAEPRFNLLICNPPYVRHHHMPNDYKSRLQLRALKACGTKIGGLAGLYCYFLGLSHAWLAPGAISGWLIPSEFMDVNYGQALKRYLLQRVTLLHIHRFDPSDVQFADALVSSAVVWFRNELPPVDHQVKFTFGGTLARPTVERNVSARALAQEAKWTRFPISETRAKSTLPTIADFFKIKRGIATGDNSYFILGEAAIRERNLPMECFRPILPSPRYLPDDEIAADKAGVPLIDRRLFLLDPRMSEHEIETRLPTLWAYLQEGRALGLHERYLCAHRALWYSQEDRPAAPIVCTYLGRSDGKSGRPFRFILNNSQATVANVYLAMYPTSLLESALRRDHRLIRAVWQVLNRITPERLLGEGRVYGGGLHKLEPKELANVPAQDIAELLPGAEQPLRQRDLFATEVAA